MAEDDRTFHTSTPEANRAETQGLGVGQRELDAQRSPGEPEEPVDEGLEDDDIPLRTGLKPEADRSQGAKTRQLNKDIVSRRT
jgi:hypothetical protein